MRKNNITQNKLKIFMKQYNLRTGFVAKLCDVSPKTIYKWRMERYNGEIPSGFMLKLKKNFIEYSENNLKILKDE
jgi:DNA-binding XRE family transcriptional regulator